MRNNSRDSSHSAGDKNRKWLHVGAEGFRLWYCVYSWTDTRGWHSQVTRILSPNSGLVLIPYYIKKCNCSFRMAGGQYFILGSSLALIVLSAHISEGRTHSDYGSDEYKQLSTTSLHPVSREKRGNSFIQNSQAPCPINLQVLISSHSQCHKY